MSAVSIAQTGVRGSRVTQLAHAYGQPERSSPITASHLTVLLAKILTPRGSLGEYR